MTDARSAYRITSAATSYFVGIIFCGVLVSYNWVFLSELMPRIGLGRYTLAWSIPFNVLWVLSTWSFVRAWATDAGSLPARWQEFVTSCGPAMPITPSRKEWQPRKATMCGKCRFPRPERAHHCAVCNRCVLRYDHHCPWINNCVGFHNYKYFILLSIYTWSLCLLVIISVTPKLPQLYLSSKNWQEDTHLILMFAIDNLSLLVCMLLSVIMHYHLPLALRNITSVEDFYDNMPNPYDQGSALGNLTQIFGLLGPDWLVPVPPFRPVSDGVTFTMDANEQRIVDIRMSASGHQEMPPEMSETRLYEETVMEDSVALLPCECSCASNFGHVDFADALTSAELGNSTSGSGPEDIWRARYRVRQLRERHDGALSAELTEGSTPKGPTLLSGLWSSFWRSREHPSRKSGVWL